MSKTVLITGATGQTGSYMIDHLIENTDNTIIAATRRTSQPILFHLEKYKDNRRVKFISLDLGDAHSIEQAVITEKPDYFINFGASAFVPDSWNSPALTMQINTVSVIHALEAIRKHAPFCRFYNACSSEIFGHVLEVPQSINTRPNPRSVYGVSKNAAREIVEVYRKSYGIYAVSGILYNHESERRQNHYVTRKITKNVGRIYRSIQKSESFEPLELGNISALRDWSHAHDFVVGVWKVLNQSPKLVTTDGVERLEGTHCGSVEHLNWSPKDYVLSSGEMHSVREFVEKAFAVAGIEGIWTGKGIDEKFILPNWISEISSVETPVLMRVNPDFYRPAEVEQLLGDSTPAREELNWQPKCSFDQLVKKMVLHDINNP